MENSTKELTAETSDSPMQIIASLKTALENSEREKEELKNQLGAMLEGLQKLDFPRLINTIERRLESSEKKFTDAERHLREELTGRMAANIEPYIEKTVRRVNDLNEGISASETKFNDQQQGLEKRFALHQQNMGVEGDKLVSKFAKSGEKLITDWQKSQQVVQANLNSVNDYVIKIYKQVSGLRDAQKKVEVAGNIFAERINLWSQVTQELENRNRESSQTLAQEQEQVTNRIQLFKHNTVKDYKNMVFRWTISSIILTFIFTALLFGLTYNQANSEIAKIKEFSSQEQTQFRQIFEASVENANRRNTGDDLKLKLYPFLISKMPEQLKGEFDSELKRKGEELKREREAKNSQEIRDVSYQQSLKQPEK